MIVGSRIIDVDWDEGRTGRISFHLAWGPNGPMTLHVGTLTGDPYPYLEEVKDGDEED